MSASPAGPPGTTPNGAPAGTTPNSGVPAAARPRPKAKANPLVQPKRPNRGAARPGAARPKPASAQRTTPIPNGMQQPLPPTQGGIIPVQKFDPPPGAKVETFPVFTTKRAFLEGLRHHVMRFQSKTLIDPTDESSFTRPIRLHRRDAGAGKSGAGADNGEDENDEEAQERARVEALKEERKRNRAEVQAQIAPKAKGKSGFTDNKKKIQQVYERNDTPEAIKASRLRYEETLPWHLEDFDNKNTWVGGYESALSGNHIILYNEPWTDALGQYRSKFRMVPVEKWYKFSAKDKGMIFSPEMVEKHEKKKGNIPRWFNKEEEKADVKLDMKVPSWIKAKEEETMRRKQMQQNKKGKVFARKGGFGDEEAPRGAPGDDYRPEIAADVDEIDFNVEEDFADDEEGVNGLFEGDDEETKRVAERVKREQLAANAFELKDEKDVWQEEEDAKLEAELRKKLEKSLRKKIVKREKNYNYDLDDSDENPYSSESESDDSEVERQKEEERKREQERAAAEKDKGKGKADEKPSSGTTSKGSNTPSGRPKTSDPLKLSTSSQSIKRPGSPNLSDASGNESSRKKQKMHGGSGSDSEATDRERKRKMQHLSGAGAGTATGTGTPGGSRAGSPVVGSGSGGASRAGSPTTGPGGLPARPRQAQAKPTGPIPTIEEIKAVIPPQGATMNMLITAFKGRVSQAVQQDFINNVKHAGTFDKKTKMIFPRAG